METQNSIVLFNFDFFSYETNNLSLPVHFKVVSILFAFSFFFSVGKESVQK